jgi:hypothetical protein
VKTRPDFTEAALADGLEELALRALREWLSSDNCRRREVWHKCFDDTFVGRALEELKTDSYYDGPWHEKALWKLRGELAGVWEKKGWVSYESPKLGRPRKAEYSEETLRKAQSIYNNGCQGFFSDERWAWAQSVLGETGNRNQLFYVLATAKVHEELVSGLDQNDLEGLTREEVAELLDLPKKFANSFVRYLLEHHDWKLTTSKVDRSTKRVLRRAKQ